MTHRRLVSVALLLAGLWSTEVRPDRTGRLDFEERLAAERIILRAYLRHQEGLTDPEAVLSGALLRERVTGYLEKSVALERLWATPVTREMLLAEWRRMVANTRFPDRLTEIVGDLGNDPILVLECFVRPVLVDRLARNFFDFDREIHREARERAERLNRDVKSGAIDPSDDHPARVGAHPRVDDSEGSAAADPPASGRLSLAAGSTTGLLLREEREAFAVEAPLGSAEDGFAVYRFEKRSWASWWDEVRRTMDIMVVEPVARKDEMLLLPGAPGAVDPCEEDDVWDNGSLDIPAEAGRWHVSVWTGTHMIVWGTYRHRHALMYDPLTDTWSRSSEFNAPVWSQFSTAVWTGSEVIVWGGEDASLKTLDTGARYNPMTDTWTPTSTVGAPVARHRHTAAWTGSEMILWGGVSLDGGTTALNSGGRYDPSTDTWTPTSTVDAPFGGQSGFDALWTGDLMIVWGGGGALGSPYGGRYDPALDEWSPVTSVEAPENGGNAAVVWTGDRMLVWGCKNGQRDGGSYDPQTDSWESISTANMGFCLYGSEGVWTGTEMIVWGGHFGGLPSGSNSGGRYDPGSDTWVPTSMINAPDPRYDHTAVWTGTHMIVWGGVSFDDGTTPLGTGGRYDPVSDTWTPTSGTNNGPTHRIDHSAVWTGTHMIVWGGFLHVPVVSGSLYDPMTDSWTPTPVAGAPPASERPAAVWTGSDMIVWGGYGNDGSLANRRVSIDTGGRFDPLTSRWEPTSLIGAPSPRGEHRAVWTGHVMLVWGGQTDFHSEVPLGDGAAYDPQTDTWQPIATAGAPSPRFNHSATWTGDRMVVWGGDTGSSVAGDGAVYDPNADIWTPMSDAGAPAARSLHTAVWTGSQVIVWGGRTACCQTSTGRRFDPAQDLWISMAASTAPSAPAIWTGDLMVVWGALEGRYSPINDRWQPIASSGAPSDRVLYSAVWTGESMIVWGGSLGLENYGTGGRYAVVPGPDADGDGHHDCVADCDDSNPTIYPGGVQICADGLNNDCAHPSWPALTGTNEVDADGDALTECEGDCDDSRAEVFPGAAQVCDGVNNDCDDGSWPALPGDEADADQDGHMTCAGDCDDANPSTYPGATQLCDGINNDCDDPMWPTTSLDEADADGDGFRICGGDCDDAAADTYPGAPQPCDGINTDCGDPDWPSAPGEADADMDGVRVCAGDCDDGNAQVWAAPGDVGTLLLIEGPAAGEATLGWSAPVQPGGTILFYDALRATVASDFDAAAICVEADDGADTSAVDALVPAAGQVLYYLVRAENDCPLGPGPLGFDSDGVPRTGRACP